MTSTDHILTAALDAIFSAPAKKLGARRQAATSRDMCKPANTAALFAKGGRYEIHASRTTGRMRDMVWVYKDGALAHSGVAADACLKVIEAVDRINAAK